MTRQNRCSYLLWGLLASASALYEVRDPAIHEPGRCAIRGHCTEGGFLSGPQPCPDNGYSRLPDEVVRKKLVQICGREWSNSAVCCTGEQLDVLHDNLKRVEPVIFACPACKENFFDLFCTFTCSPDQSLFVNVTGVAGSGKRLHVTELNALISDEFASGFFNSCKDVQFGATNGKAMDFIGDGARTFSEFLSFLGNKKPLGSPFQINFPRPDTEAFPSMVAMNRIPKSCSDEASVYRCACVDCPAACRTPSKVPEEGRCYVGLIPCLSFGAILVYALFIIALILAMSGRVLYRQHMQRRTDRLRLLQDASVANEDDEGNGIDSFKELDTLRGHYRLNVVLQGAFGRLGRICAEYPALTIISCVIAVAFLSMGWTGFAVETDPVHLWVAPESAAAKEKAFFDAQFGPFFRIEQAFLVNENVSESSVLSYDTLRWWFDVETRVRRLRSPQRGITLDQICYKPVGDACVVQSISGYFGGPTAEIDPQTWQDTITKCTDSPVSCLPDFKQPLKPNLVLGGWRDDDVLNAQALVVTWVVTNHEEGTTALDDAKDYEKALKELLLSVQKEAKERGARLSFNTEVSLEQELSSSTNTDAKIVIISYIIMFVYASVALGSANFALQPALRNPPTIFVHSKFSLGIVGILIVLMSVTASVGLFSAVGIKVTLIIAEVIPFLVLAVGVDNIFLLVHELERVNANHAVESVSDRLAATMGRVGPSILFSALTETVAFALGTLVGMPAVRNFAAYAAGAVFINALLQVTLFVSVLALNQLRVEANRADCIPCVRVKSSDAGRADVELHHGADEGYIDHFVRTIYAPMLLAKEVKIIALIAFGAVFAAALALLPYVRLGLDQRIAIPKTSYLIHYFNDLDTYLDIGPPVYFVTKEMNVTERSHQLQLCGRFASCDQSSLANVLEQERKRPEISYISEPTASWLDDFFLWLNPVLEDCCVSNNRPCFKDRDPAWNSMLLGMPEGREFLDYLGRWLRAPPTEDCPLAGSASYGDALAVDSERITIHASHFRTSHSALHSQEDFINAYRAARRIADDFSGRNGVEVFPYSKFYIFFDQYISILSLTGALISSAVAVIFILSFALLGSFRTALVVTVTVVMTVIDIIGSMTFAGVSLNAVSLVNLVICVGISVEFCAHIARAFTFPSRTVLDRVKHGQHQGKDRRAWAALIDVGGSVFTGITITKLLGVIVLAFTRSKIFEVYYFRIWLALIILAATHALIFLPVALSLFGGRGYVESESHGGLEQDLRSRRYPPLLTDHGYDSDD